MNIYEKFKKAKATQDAANFPDGFAGDVKITTVVHNKEGYFGQRIIVNFESLDGKNTGYLSLGLDNPKIVDANMGRLKSCFVAALGFDPYSPAEFEKSGIDGDEGSDIFKAAVYEDLFRNVIVNIKVSHKRNEKNEAKPFVNFKFAPVLDAKGEPKRAA